MEKRWMRSYRSLKSRCSYHPRYAGRGIKALITPDDVEFLWKRDGADKMADPTIDRIDNDGNYELSNCRFIERRANSLRNVVDECCLDMKKARAIRSEYKKGVYGFGFKALARKYGVSKRLIIFVLNGKSWNEQSHKNEWSQKP